MSLVLERPSAVRGLSKPIDLNSLRTRLVLHPARLDWLGVALVCLFLIGLYTNYTIQLSAKLPFPSAPAGVAGAFACCGGAVTRSRLGPSYAPWPCCAST